MLLLFFVLDHNYNIMTKIFALDESDALFKAEKRLRLSRDSFLKGVYFYPCEYCLNKIEKEPILEEWLGKFSVLCPYCCMNRGRWGDSMEEAIKNWNEGTDNRS